MYLHVFSHYAGKNNPLPLYIAVGTVVPGVLLIVAIVTTVAIVVCCKKCILTKGGVQEPQVEHEVREDHTVCKDVCVTSSDHAVALRPSKRRTCSCYDRRCGRQHLKLGRG